MSLERERRGKEIAERRPDQVRRINKRKFMVLSQTRKNEEHMVHYGKTGWVCTCNDFSYRQKKCKHIYALEFRQIIKDDEKKKPTWIIPALNSVSCPFCGSHEFRKFGWRYNKKRKEQRYDCLNDKCRRKFCANDGFKGLKYRPEVITFAMNLYFYGLSMRSVTKCLKLLGVDISHHSVYRWLVHYVQIMQMYFDSSIVPIVGRTWRADEIFLKIKGRQRYVFMSMDDKTRFWISKEVADTKFHHDARKLLSIAKQVTKTVPSVFITDGSPVYYRAFRKEMHGLGKDDIPIHINTIHLDGNHNNNMMERLNGEFKDIEKTKRGVKKKDSIVISGHQVFHNYFRPHSSLGGKIPAEIAGVRIEGDDKIKTIIQNASREIVPKQYSITEFFGEEMKIPVRTDENGEMSLDSC